MHKQKIAASPKTFIALSFRQTIPLGSIIHELYARERRSGGKNMAEFPQRGLYGVDGVSDTTLPGFDGWNGREETRLRIRAAS
jgi:hypothetical protein